MKDRKLFLETDLVEIIADNAHLGIGMIIFHEGKDPIYEYEVFVFAGQYKTWFADWELHPIFQE